MPTFTEKLAKYRISTAKERKELMLEWGEPVGESELEIQITLDAIYQSDTRAWIVSKANEPTICKACKQAKPPTKKEVQDATKHWSDRLLHFSYRNNNEVKTCQNTS